ncbi:MAG: RraA family protein, partial [Candidatus Latescibacteria bacterium]|nr:RraA family protein [Candidatus Latescibacterota bacterium]
MRERKTCLLPFLVIIFYIFVPPAISIAQIGALETDIIEYTSLWKGERFLDGRPKVPDEILERMKEVSIEEAWGVLISHEYRHQFETGWDNMHPERVIVGRAVTATFMPKRPDVQNETEKRGKEQGRIGGQNSWVIYTLVENDLVVVDMFKTRNFVGDNLANWIATKTGTGMVIHGGNRDIDGIYEIPDF